MKGKIDTDGILFIERKQKNDEPFYSDQLCPFGRGNCGDWCPLFGEPERSFAGRGVKLQLCHRTLEFEELEDER